MHLLRTFSKQEAKMIKLTSWMVILPITIFFSSCVPLAPILDPGVLGTAVIRSGGERTEKKDPEVKTELGKRHWDPGKKKYFRYDNDGNKIYE
jgi:hypothetical protein